MFFQPLRRYSVDTFSFSFFWFSNSSRSCCTSLWLIISVSTNFNFALNLLSFGQIRSSQEFESIIFLSLSRSLYKSYNQIIDIIHSPAYLGRNRIVKIYHISSFHGLLLFQKYIPKATSKVLQLI